jgi:Region found in RelA / SpoT proteins
VRSQIEEFAQIIEEIEASKEELTLTASKLSNKQINRAGKTLGSESIGGLNSAEAYTVVSEWRASHSYPLRAIATVLKRNALSVNSRALISGRLKRMESIGLKLRRQLQRLGHMDLISMQDIGGCRAVMWHVNEVHAVVERLKVLFPENGPFKPEYDDYIQKPKPDGYRGVHIAVRYNSKLPAHSAWSGRRIEMQIRSTLQHAWATAVETVDLFANEKLKIGQGSQKWSRFFALASSVFARRENGPLVPDTPTESTEELRALWSELHVVRRLNGWMTAMNFIEPNIEGVTYLLTLDVAQRTIVIAPFGPPYIALANDAYAVAEEENRHNPDRNSVLVSVDKIGDLKKSFPNYYADTADFLRALAEDLDDWSDIILPPTNPVTAAQ